jgi:RHS repeat-associated protein
MKHRATCFCEIIATLWLGLAPPLLASLQRTDFNGHTTSYTYHPTRDFLLSKSVDPSHPSHVLDHAPSLVEYGYDLLGRRTHASVKNNTGDLLHSQSWAYDNRDRITTHAQPLATLSYTYDAASNLTATESSTSDGYHMSYEHDALNRMAAALDHNTLDSQNQPARTGYSYTSVGTLQSVTLPNGLSHFYHYNTRHQLSSCGIANTTNQTVLGYTYTLNKLGMRTEVEEFTIGSGNTPVRTINYLYDTLHRLIEEGSAGVSPSLTGTVSYTLDAVGNRTQRTSTLSAVPNQAQTHDVNDRLTTDTTDANGNTLASASLRSEGVSPSSVTTTDLYDFENRLIRRVENPTTTNQKTIDVLYDADGNRVAKRSDDWQSSSPSVTHYLLDSNNPTGYTQVLEEHITTPAAGASDPFSLITYPSSLTTVYAYGQDLISQDRKTGHTTWSLSYYCYDGGGHVRALANEVGTLTDTYTFDAFGVLIAKTGSTENHYLYRGEQFDPDLGLYYQRARYLNTDTGRFWTQDTYEGSPGTPASLHKYFYANGDPVSGWDPSGNMTLAETLTSMAVAGAINAVIGVSFNLFDKDITADEVWGDLAKDFAIGAALAPVGGVLAKAFGYILRPFAAQMFSMVGKLQRITLVGRPAVEKIMVRISRFFLNTNVKHPPVGSTLLGSILKRLFPSMQWEMHHVAVQQFGSRVGSSGRVFADTAANEGLRRVGNGLWNLLPIPRNLNNYLGRAGNDYAAELFATAYYSIITFGASQTFGEIFLED